MAIISIRMLREDLEEIPRYPLPEGYAMRRFRPGDRATWVRIEQESDPEEGLSGETFDAVTCDVHGRAIRSSPTTPAGPRYSPLLT